VRTGDVGALIRATRGAFDATLLDVDNGPDGLTRPDNDVLYREDGLRSSRRALSPGGVLAVWSAAPDPAFSARLSRCGFDVSTHTVWAGRTRRGTRHTIWIATSTATCNPRTSAPGARARPAPSRHSCTVKQRGGRLQSRHPAQRSGHSHGVGTAPQSIKLSVPAILPARSEAMKAIRSTISAGVQRRPTGCRRGPHITIRLSSSRSALRGGSRGGCGRWSARPPHA
jgi:hypothetical protein